MARFMVKRILQMVPVLFLVSVFSFLIVHQAPGDPINMYITPDTTEEELEYLRTSLGLDGSIVEQYVGWLKKVLQGDMGRSLITNKPVAPEIVSKLGATVSLMGTAFVLSLVISIPLGLIAGLHKNRWVDNLISLFSYIGISIPAFWFALVLIIIFGLKLHWLPFVGMRTTGVNTTLDLLQHYILPSIVLSVGNVATFTRYIRSNTITQLEEEYVLTAKAKGVSRGRILTHHVLKNCLLPVITLAGMNFASLVTGSFIVESIFGWPGMGTLGMSAINSRDYPKIMAFTMLSCLLLIVGNFLADILYCVADPRIKAGIEEARS